MTTTASADALQRAVETAYKAFSTFRRATPPLDVCTVCCVSEEVDRVLREEPLRRLTAAHFYEYNNSAKSEVQRSEEIGFFLPRMLELLAEGEDIHHSLELSLDRLGRCPRGDWTQEQREAIEGFAHAYFDHAIAGGRLGAAGHCRNDPLSIVLMFAIGGVEPERLLSRWLRCDLATSTIQFVDDTYFNFWGEPSQYRNPFVESLPGIQQTIGNWLLDPQHRRVFAEKLLLPEFLALAERQSGHRYRNVSFKLMSEAVFEHLTR